MNQRIEKLSDHQHLYEFLSYCMYPVHERITKECDRYMTEPNRELFGIYTKSKLAGVIGLRNDELETEILHIAVHPDFRNKGLGSALIEQAITLKAAQRIVAETDHDAVTFYKKNGFTINSLGEKYPGVERFKCVFAN